MDAWTAAGRGVECLCDALVAGHSLGRPLEGFSTPVASIPEAVDAETLLAEVVAAVLPRDRGRVGLVVATTSGAISGSFEAWMRRGAPPEEERGWRAEPGRAVARRFGLDPVLTVSVACASGTAAFEIAAAWLRAGRCDAVVVAGVEKHSFYIHAGFAGLGALGPKGARPFAADRDGLLLGEGAAAVLLEPANTATVALAELAGVATSQDAFHLTAPRPDGDGLARAIRVALGRAGLTADEIDVVSGHGTGTVLNDAAEARALSAVFGNSVPLHAIKGVVGHCLGAAGVIEAVVCVAAFGGADLPRPPETPLLGVRAPTAIDNCVSVNAAFGGVNAAAVFCRVGRQHVPPWPAPSPDRGAMTSSRLASFEMHALPLAEIWPDAPPALGRADRYTRAGVRLLREVASQLDDETLVVLHSATDCRAADLRYYAGVLARGITGASRLHFPYTIPGSPLAEGSIAAGLGNPAWVLCEGDVERVDPATLLRGSGYRHLVLCSVEAPSDDPHSSVRASATLYT